MNNIDRNKLLLEYQRLLQRLDSAENWAIDNNFNWDDVKKHKYKIWHERDNIIKEIEFVKSFLFCIITPPKLALFIITF